MPTTDIKEIAKRGYKGDEDAPKELMELAEEAHKSGNFEFASDCYRQAALVFKLNRWRVGLVRDDLESQLKWSETKLALYQDYCEKQNYPAQKYNHSFSSDADVWNLFPKFMHKFGKKYAVPFHYFEEVLQSRGVTFSSPGNSSLRNLTIEICSALELPDNFHRSSKKRDLRIRVALDEIIPDFLAWAEK